MKTAILSRFTIVLAHAFVTAVLYTQRYYNVVASIAAANLDRQDSFSMEYFKIDNAFAWLLAIAVILNAVEVLLLSFGHPLAVLPNLLAAALHAAGIIVTCQMLISAWPAEAFFTVFIFSAVVPLAIAFAHAVDLLVFRSSLLRRINIRI